MLRNLLANVPVVLAQVADAAGSGSGETEPTETVPGTVTVNGRTRPNTDRVQSKKTHRVPTDRRLNTGDRYGAIVFTMPDSAGVKPGRNGSKNGSSTIMANVSVEIPSIGAVVPCTVWARLTSTATEESITPEPAIWPGKMSFSDSDDRDAMLNAILKAGSKWDGFTKAFSAAERRLTKPPVQPGTGSGENAVWGARVVKSR